MLICPHCNKASGYIRKTFELQEKGENWEPILRGVVKLGEVDDTYQPFVFLVSYEPDEEEGKSQTPIEWPITSLWFSYYKDLRGHPRADGSPGRLKMGFGPGGPPVINVAQLLELLRHVLKLKIVDESDVAELLTKQT
jgi:hypothetical protein